MGEKKENKRGIMRMREGEGEGRLEGNREGDECEENAIGELSMISAQNMRASTRPYYSSEIPVKSRNTTTMTILHGHGETKINSMILRE